MTPDELYELLKKYTDQQAVELNKDKEFTLETI